MNNPSHYRPPAHIAANVNFNRQRMDSFNVHRPPTNFKPNLADQFTTSNHVTLFRNAGPNLEAPRIPYKSRSDNFQNIPGNNRFPPPYAPPPTPVINRPQFFQMDAPRGPSFGHPKFEHTQVSPINDERQLGNYPIGHQTMTTPHCGQFSMQQDQAQNQPFPLIVSQAGQQNSSYTSPLSNESHMDARCLHTSHAQNLPLNNMVPNNIHHGPPQPIQTHQAPNLTQYSNLIPEVSNSGNLTTVPVLKSFAPSQYQTQPAPNFPPPLPNFPRTPLHPQNMQMNSFSNMPRFPPFSLPVFPANEVCNSQVASADPEMVMVKQLLQKYKDQKQTKLETGTKITVANFRSNMVRAFHILNELSGNKKELENMIDADETKWKLKLEQILMLQDDFTNLCNELSDPEQMELVLKKLQKIKKRRDQKACQKLTSAVLKKQKEQERAEMHSVINRWHDGLREKEQQKKREEEMKKEADNILSEVRKKIYEAKRTIEKMKILEKLRQARRENAVKKGMFILPKHDRSFEVKISSMKDIMLKQLSDYEGEERALQVMLETEQEGEREERQNWKIKKLEEIQDRKHKNILSCLFGNTDPPPITSEMSFYWHNYNIAETSIENIVNIRKAWDIYLVPPDSSEGSSIPHQWVVPEPSSSDAWSSVLKKNN